MRDAREHVRHEARGGEAQLAVRARGDREQDARVEVAAISRGARAPNHSPATALLHPLTSSHAQSPIILRLELHRRAGSALPRDPVRRKPRLTVTQTAAECLVRSREGRQEARAPVQPRPAILSAAEDLHGAPSHGTHSAIPVSRQQLGLFRAHSLTFAAVLRQVTVTTGTGRGAGTSANVWLQLFGSDCPKGTERFSLDQDPLNFEAGRRDVFRLPQKLQASGTQRRRPSCLNNRSQSYPQKGRNSAESPLLPLLPPRQQVGRLTSVRVGHDSEGSAPSWLLAKLEVQAEGEPAVTAFDIPPKGLWLDPKAADAKTEREVKVLEGGKKPASQAKMKYKARRAALALLPSR